MSSNLFCKCAPAHSGAAQGQTLPQQSRFSGTHDNSPPFQNVRVGFGLFFSYDRNTVFSQNHFQFSIKAHFGMMPLLIIDIPDRVLNL